MKSSNVKRIEMKMWCALTTVILCRPTYLFIIFLVNQSISILFSSTGTQCLYIYTLYTHTIRKTQIQSITAIVCRCCCSTYIYSTCHTLTQNSPDHDRYNEHDRYNDNYLYIPYFSPFLLVFLSTFFLAFSASLSLPPSLSLSLSLSRSLSPFPFSLSLVARKGITLYNQKKCQRGAG